MCGGDASVQLLIISYGFQRLPKVTEKNTSYGGEAYLFAFVICIYCYVAVTLERGYRRELGYLPGFIVF